VGKEMPFPESKRVVYEHNPLVQVICQLRFPTILQISSQEPAAFQNKLRSEYPLYTRVDRRAAFPKEISDLLAHLAVSVPPEGVTHKFLTEDSTRFISLADDFLAITEEKYHRWEAFREEIKLSKGAVEEIYTPAFYSRIGLRYRDVIDRAALGLAAEPWDSLVNPSLIGVLGAAEVRDQVQGINAEALVRLDQIPGGFVRIRHGLTKPAQDGHEAYQVDVDCFTEERGASEDVSGVLNAFNRVAGNLFRWAITPRLRDALNPLDID